MRQDNSGIGQTAVKPRPLRLVVGAVNDMVIREIKPDDYPAVIEIGEALPEWFDERARRKSIPIDVRHQDGYIAIEDGLAVGFITLYVSDGRLNIGWLGVRKECQRKGIGHALLRQAEARARGLGISEIATYTLGDRVDYEPYEPTRRFYFRNGFRVYQRSQTDNPGCPEEIRIAKKVPEADAQLDEDSATLHPRQ